MKPTIFLLIPLIFIGACSSNKKTTSTKTASSSKINRLDILRGGSSYENAIVIKVETERAGVQEEYKWLSQNYPGYATIRKSQANKGKKHYDIIRIRTRDGEEKNIYFDTTSFFGKW